MLNKSALAITEDDAAREAVSGIPRVLRTAVMEQTQVAPEANVMLVVRAEVVVAMQVRLATKAAGVPADKSAVTAQRPAGDAARVICVVRSATVVQTQVGVAASAAAPAPAVSSR
ncbi:MAG: hypothetical protein KGL39_09805 [Patescibacteria group bacterium]|nr:hypothetical protein [Patescibacteria group bacterium]